MKWLRVGALALVAFPYVVARPDEGAWPPRGEEPVLKRISIQQQ